MTRLLPDRTETALPDGKPPYTAGQATIEANRCLFCHDAPCIQACPTGIDIPGFIRKISTGNARGAARTIFDSNILGTSCARVCPVEVLCVGDCVYNIMDVPPIQIGRLQRYATDLALADGRPFYQAGPDSGRSVGLVGGGPASLACAHRLRMLGHAVTIYEARPDLGGLNTTGVAPYKMLADRSLEEVDWILSIGGIEVQTGVSVPHDVPWAALEARHDALFIGLGLGPDSRLAAQGEELAGVHGAVAWIEEMKLSRVDLSSVRRALVIGGGNTAIDAVRELKGLGIPEVALVYRGSEAGMSGYRHEWEAARKAGVGALWGRQPVAFVGAEGRVQAVRCVHLDDQKRPLPGSEHEVPADLVLLAIGQGKLAALVEGLEGVAVAGGRILADARGATGRPGVFAGGDCVNGGKEVVNAAAMGRDAALAVHDYLSSLPPRGA